MKPRLWAIAHAVASTAGLFFASWSTLDFVAHLDRQTHELHCSFVPGLVTSGESHGCQATLMSPYSSVLRDHLWGGIPISLGAMAVFAFLAFRAVDLMGRPPPEQKSSAAVLLAFTMVPVVMSAVMGLIAYTQLHAACKLCIGIYGASALCLGAAVGALVSAPRVPSGASASPTNAPPTGPNRAGIWIAAIAQSGAFVVLPVVMYLAIAPDFTPYLGECGALEDTEDPYGVLVPLDDHASGTDAVEVFDPLCPACRGFEERVAASSVADRLHRRALMFPLDSECNWMVPHSVHPGACAVSEAVLCAHRGGLDPREVTAWAFENQEEIMEAERKTPGSAAKRAKTAFPALASCVGTAEVKADLNKSLRWAVSHQVPVLTPQLYVAGMKVCDADTDLGLDWAVTKILDNPQVEVATTPAREATAPPARAPRPEPQNRAGSAPRAESESKSKPPKASEPAAAREPSEPAPPELGPGKLPAVEQLEGPAERDRVNAEAADAKEDEQ